MEEFISKLNNLNTFKTTGKCSHLSDSLTEDKIKDKTLYFGTGLAAVSGPSSGFGVEFLNTFCTAIWLQKQLGFKKVIHEISTVGYNIDPESRERLIAQEEFIITNLIRNLKLQDTYQLNFSHNYHESDEFRAMEEYVATRLATFNDIPNFEGISDYTTLQLAGMKHLYETEGTRIKLGWITDKKASLAQVGEDEVRGLIAKGHLNEYYFDNMYRYVFPNDDYSFLYTPCAIDLQNGNRTVPYNVLPNQSRPVLNGRSIKGYVGSIPKSKVKDKVIKSWSEDIVGLFEDVFFELPTEGSQDPEEAMLEKLDFIQKKLCNLERSKPNNDVVNPNKRVKSTARTRDDEELSL